MVLACCCPGAALIAYFWRQQSFVRGQRWRGWSAQMYMIKRLLTPAVSPTRCARYLENIRTSVGVLPIAWHTPPRANFVLDRFARR